MNLMNPLTSNTGFNQASLQEVYKKVSETMMSQNTLAPKINSAIALDNTRISGLGQLQSSLASFQDVLQSLSAGGISVAANSANSKIATATTTSNSPVGTFSVDVKQLAQGQVLSSKAQSKPDAIVGSGLPTRIQIDLGSLSGSGFETSGSNGKNSLTVNIKAGNQTLQGIADSINAAKSGVQASIEKNTDGYSLRLTSPTGAQSSMKLTVNGDPALKALLSYDAANSASGMKQTQASQDASVVVNGITLSSSSNTVSNALSGTTLNLGMVGSTTLTVSKDSQPLAQNISTFVNAYNALDANLAKLQQGDLKNHGATSRVEVLLSRTLITGAENSKIKLDDIGISVQGDGTLKLDGSKLQAAISSNAAGVAELFSKNGSGLAESLSQSIKSQIGIGGDIARDTTVLKNDLSTLNEQQNALDKTLTLQAQALAAKYTMQSLQGNSLGASSLFGSMQGNSQTLFDVLF